MTRIIRRLIDAVVIWFHCILAYRERQALKDIVHTPIPPNDASKNELQDCCYDMRDIACKALRIGTY